MKKIFYLLFIMFSFVMGMSYSYADNANVNITTSGYYWNRVYNGVSSSYPFNLYDFNGRVAYCIMPGIPEGTTYNAGDYSNSGLSEDIRDRIMLISYYGYEYPEHRTFLYRSAAQELIWETIIPADTVFSTGRYTTGNILNNENEKEEILRLVNNHYTKPAFDGMTIDSEARFYEIWDYKGVLKNYEVVSGDNSEAYIKDNSLFVNPSEVGTVTVNLKRKQYTDKNYVVWYGANSQTMLSSGRVNDVYSSVSFNFKGGVVSIDKIDSENNSNIPQGEGTLEGACYGIYNAFDDSLVSKIVTDYKGHGESDPLPRFGKYYLKEISASVGYEVSDEKYSFTSDINSINYNTTIKENVIKKNIIFFKMKDSGKTGLMYPEENVEFSIVNSKGEEVYRGKTDDDGKISVSLPYGKYIIKQLSGEGGYEFIDDYEFEVRDSVPLNKVFVDKKIEAKLKVIKVDSETGNVIKGSAKFKIWSVDDNLYVCYKASNGKSDICEFETDSDGEFITPISLSSGKYILKEISSPYGYVISKEEYEFSIDDGASFDILDNERVLTIEFANKKVKTNVDVSKYGEVSKNSGGNISYDMVLMDGCEFGLYADSDIYDENGNRIYGKDEEIMKFNTENGKFSIRDLLFGKYYIKELKSLDGYVLSDKEYRFELTGDGSLEEIRLNVNIYNYLCKGSLEIIKKDGTSGEGLSFAKYDIYDSNDNLVYSGETDNSGILRVDNLPVGEYYFKEVTAPNGYVLDSGIYYFRLGENREVIKKNVINERIEVPRTSSNVSVWPLLGILVSALGGVIFKRALN